MDLKNTSAHALFGHGADPAIRRPWMPTATWKKDGCWWPPVGIVVLFMCCCPGARQLWPPAARTLHLLPVLSATVKKFFSLFFVILLCRTARPGGWWAICAAMETTPSARDFPGLKHPLWRIAGLLPVCRRMVPGIPARRKPLKIFHNWLNYHLFSATSVAGVHIGIHGWLYPGQTSQTVLAPAVARQAGRRLFLELHAAEKMINATGRRFLFTVAPGKAAIYPEYVGSGAAGCRKPRLQGPARRPRRVTP
jgi:hypothetical protein